MNTVAVEKPALSKWRTALKQEALPLAGLALLTILAAGLRRYQLGYQGLWFDEADVVWRATQPLSTILAGFGQSGENGPLYTLLLHFWTAVAGSSEVAVRLPSFAFGVLTVPLIYLVGRRILNPTLGLIAAFLLAISPYHLWYSQEAKMYTLVAFLSLLSTCIFLVALKSDRRGWWVAYVLVTTLALYVHLASILVVVFQTAFYLVSWRRLRASRRGWLISLGCLTLPYLPILVWETRFLLGSSGAGSWYPTVGLIDIFRIIFAKFSVNRGPEPYATISIYSFLALFVLGFVPFQLVLRKKRGGQASGDGDDRDGRDEPEFSTWRRITFNGLYFFLPILAFAVLSLRVSVFTDRYLIVALPAFYLAVGMGLVFLRRLFAPLAAVGLALLIVSSAASVNEINYSPKPQKEDWRGAVSYIKSHFHPYDAVITLPGYLTPATSYYNDRSSPSLNMPLLTLPSPLTKGFGDREFEAELRRVAYARDRVWLIVSPERYPLDDPESLIKNWFDWNTLPFNVKVFNGLIVYGYSFNMPFGTGWYPPTPHKVRADFGGQITLDGYDYETFDKTAKIPQGTFLPLALYWIADKPVAKDYTIFVHVIDANGKIQSQQDIGPLDGYYPTSKMNPGMLLRDYHDLYIRLDVPPGEYKVEVGLYTPQDGRLEIYEQGKETGRDSVNLENIQVVPGTGR